MFNDQLKKNTKWCCIYKREKVFDVSKYIIASTLLRHFYSKSDVILSTNARIYGVAHMTLYNGTV